MDLAHQEPNPKEDLMQFDEGQSTGGGGNLIDLDNNYFDFSNVNQQEMQ